MFTTLLEECVGLPDATLDELLRANELELRRLTAERAALVGVIEHRQAFAGEHRSMTAFLRATVNCSDGTAGRDRRLAKLLTAHPEIGDLLAAGHLPVDAALLMCRVQSNPRVRQWLPLVVTVLAELAEHSTYQHLSEQVTNLIARLDEDGAFDELEDAVAGRTAGVHEVAGGLVVRAHGGDPLQAAQVTAIFEAWVDAEYRRDVADRKAAFGDESEQHPLPRTGQQRRFDALVAIFAAAHASPDGQALPEPTVGLVVDATTARDALATAGIVLPGGDEIRLDDDGDLVEEEQLLTGLAGELVDDPEAFLRRRCETARGTPVQTSVILRALLTGSVRRVVMDSRGVVIDYGTRQRLFSGLARQAAMLLARTCEFPGCTLPAAWCDVDHNVEWHAGGATDQRNRNIGCHHHNVRKHRERWRTRRDQRGRAYTIRDDGTIILPVGERPPDLSIDEMTELIRARLRSLVD